MYFMFSSCLLISAVHTTYKFKTLIYICNINYEQPAKKSDIFNNIAQYVMD